MAPYPPPEIVAHVRSHYTAASADLILADRDMVAHLTQRLASHRRHPRVGCDCIGCVAP